MRFIGGECRKMDNKNTSQRSSERLILHLVVDHIFLCWGINFFEGSGNPSDQIVKDSWAELHLMSVCGWLCNTPARKDWAGLCSMFPAGIDLRNGYSPDPFSQQTSTGQFDQTAAITRTTSLTHRHYVLIQFIGDPQWFQYRPVISG